MSYDQFLRFIFPEGMFDYFELSDFKEKSDRVEIYFEEKNIHPKEYATNNLESKGFYEQVRMQDYPMRGRSCLLFIKKRRWFNHSTGKYVSRNWKLVAEGTQVQSLFAFLLPLRYDFSTQDFGMIHEKITKRHTFVTNSGLTLPFKYQSITFTV